MGLSNAEDRIVKCSKGRLKYVCEQCEVRLEDANSANHEQTLDTKHQGDADLLVLVNNLSEIVKNLVSDNKQIKEKLDTVITTNYRLEMLLPHSEKQSEGASKLTKIVDKQYVAVVENDVPGVRVKTKQVPSINLTQNQKTSLEYIRETAPASITDHSSNNSVKAAVCDSSFGNIVNNITAEASISSINKECTSESKSNVENKPSTDVNNLIGENSPANWQVVNNKQAGRTYSTVLNQNNRPIKTSTDTTRGSKLSDRTVPQKGKPGKQCSLMPTTQMSENISTSTKVVIGTSDGKGMLYGDKKAWFHLSKLRDGTTAETVSTFLTNTFPNHNSFTVEKLETKGLTNSFKIAVDFELKDKMMDNNIWPKNVAVRRFFLSRRMSRAPVH